jgi:tRNA threonylcarbamoyladenosine biosynthesis protein TsaE
MEYSFKTANEGETFKLAGKLAKNLKGGEVIELTGDLGSGKTAFTRGLVLALKSPDDVASPSFTISRVYKTENFTIHHFDFYRLNEGGVVGQELDELIGDPKIVIIIEWAQTIQHILPVNRLTINLTSITDSKRSITFYCPSKLEYLMKGLK